MNQPRWQRVVLTWCVTFAGGFLINNPQHGAVIAEKQENCSNRSEHRSGSAAPVSDMLATAGPRGLAMR